ncbi:MAG: sulfotransferase [Candidatus Krumholzibacteriia bacterium]
MSPWVGAVLLLAGFVVVASRLRLGAASRSAISLARSSLDTFGAALSDDEKEAIYRRSAIRLFGFAVRLLAGGAAAVLGPLAILWGADRLGVVSLDEVLAAAMSPLFLAVSFAAVGAAMWASRGGAEVGSLYSAADRALYRIAFATRPAQIALADVEDRLLKDESDRGGIDRPVFISGLPRAGTTLLLGMLADLDEFAAHSYRDMPFVLTPYLWSRFSGRFHKPGELRERAHGDGMLIDYDSSEALEEVIWKVFWKAHYAKDRIVPWGAGRNEEFEEFFRNHLRKIVRLRSSSPAGEVRYVSKNNLNIARVRYLKSVFPAATIVVPYRRPLDQAASMLRQHRNFLAVHEKDSFAREYMREIGHFDFGRHLKPIDLGGWLEDREHADSATVGYWLEYWVAVYRHLVETSADLVDFCSYDDLCLAPATSLTALARTVGCRADRQLTARSASLHPPHPPTVDDAGIPRSLLDLSEEVFGRLQRQSINGGSAASPRR